MGSSLSCDRCGVVLDQGEPDCSPLVWERRLQATGDEETVEHLCLGCFREGADEGYTRRTVYACVGEENARQFAKEGARR